MAVATQLIAITHPDDSVSVMCFVCAETHNGQTSWTRYPTPENVANEIARTFEGRKAVKSWRLIAPEEVPSDRTFRAAWRDSGRHMYHDMGTCREVHRERLRKARKPLLEDLDVKYMRALESAESTAEVTAEKQRLRDCTKDPRIDAAQTPEELKAVKLSEK